MILVISLSLSLLVILGGLFMLAKSKKDSLGNLYIFSSYSAIVLGALMFAGAVIGGACMMSCGHNKGHSSCYVSPCGQGHGSAMKCGSMSCSSKCAGQDMKAMCNSGGFGGRGHHGMKSKCSAECKNMHAENQCACPHCAHKSGRMKKSVETEVVVEEDSEEESED